MIYAKWENAAQQHIKSCAWMVTTKFHTTGIWTKCFQSIKNNLCLPLDLKKNPYCVDYTNYNAAEFLLILQPLGTTNTLPLVPSERHAWLQIMGIDRLYSKSFHTLRKENNEFSLHKIHSMKSPIWDRAMHDCVLLTPGIKIKAEHGIKKMKKRVKVVEKRNKKKRRKAGLETGDYLWLKEGWQEPWRLRIKTQHICERMAKSSSLILFP